MQRKIIYALPPSSIPFKIYLRAPYLVTSKFLTSFTAQVVLHLYKQLYLLPHEVFSENRIAFDSDYLE